MKFNLAREYEHLLKEHTRKTSSNKFRRSPIRWMGNLMLDGFIYGLYNLLRFVLFVAFYYFFISRRT
jgi:Fe2+ transport system protein B